MPITERTKKLKSRVVSKACHGGGYFENVKPDLERARLWTESYMHTEGESEVIRRAKALAHTLKNMTIYINDDELIIGNNTPSQYLLYLSPEINAGPIEEAIEDGFFNKTEIQECRKILEYWKGKTMREWVEFRMTDREKEINSAGAPVISITHLDGAEHCAPNWGHVYGNGLKNIIRHIEEKKCSTSDPSKKDFYEATLITCRAFTDWCKRYAKLACEQAVLTKTPQRKAELEKIATIMDKLLISPPSSFHEALQGFFSIHLILQYIDRAGFGSLARIDQMWWPFYKKDLDSGVLTKAQAQELLECLWIKMLDLGYWFPKKRRLHFEGNSLLQTLTLGGVDEDGKDACNELTEVILDSVKSTRNNQPTFNFRYHPKTSQSALEKAIEVVKTGMGMPAFLNDEIMIYTLTDQGVPLKEARNWGVVGCVSACPVNCQITTKRLAQSSIVAKCLELALNNGRCAQTGKLLGPETGDPSKFSYEDIEEAFKKQVEFAFTLSIKIRNISRQYESQFLQRPLASALHISTIEKGEDSSSFEDYPNLWMNCVGMIDVSDSFTVVKKMVFDEKVITMKELVDILKANWKGHETFRQRCINKVPKFGNDDDYADDIAKKVFKTVALEARKVKDIFNGGGYRILPQSVSLYVSSGKNVAALPSGRLAGEFLSDGGASPQHGMDHNGPTAVLNSTGKLDHKLTKGILVNQRFMPEALDGPEGMKRFKAYLATWAEKGNSQIQFNVVNNETLRDAQTHPEKYGDLIVRVAGYSAYFTQLNKAVQDAIINRRAQRWS